MCGCIALATIGLIIGSPFHSIPAVSLTISVIGILWLVAVIRRYQRISSLSFVIFLFLAAYAAWKGTLSELALLVVIASLSAWDLAAMRSRFLQVKPSAMGQGLEHQHLVRLAIIDSAALIVGGAALVIKLQVGFMVILGLSSVVIWGLSHLVLNLRRLSD